MSFKYFFLSLLVWSLVLVPVAVYAQTNQGLIVCGAQGQEPCTFAHFIKLAQRIIDFMLYTVMIPLATISFAYAGIKYMQAGVSGGSPQAAKDIFTWTFSGVAIASTAFLVIRTLLNFMVDSTFIKLQ